MKVVVCSYDQTNQLLNSILNTCTGMFYWQTGRYMIAVINDAQKGMDISVNIVPILEWLYKRKTFVMNS